MPNITAIQPKEEQVEAAMHSFFGGYSKEEVARIIKDKINDKASNEEIGAFLVEATHMGLDPMKNQIYLVSRYNGQSRKYEHQTQVSIGGLRLMAQRTGRYVGITGEFFLNEKGQWQDYWVGEKPPVAARVKIGVLTESGQMHETVGTAYYDEYVGRKSGGEVTRMWREKTRLMLIKCAEAVALRRAFPEQLSSAYTVEEMQQAANPTPLEETGAAAEPELQRASTKTTKPLPVQEEQKSEVKELLAQLDEETQKATKKWFKEKDRTAKEANNMIMRLREKIEEAQAQTEAQEAQTEPDDNF